MVPTDVAEVESDEDTLVTPTDEVPTRKTPPTMSRVFRRS